FSLFQSDRPERVFEASNGGRNTGFGTNCRRKPSLSRAARRLKRALAGPARRRYCPAAFDGPRPKMRRGAIVVVWDGLETRCPRKGTVSSNLPLSATSPATLENGLESDDKERFRNRVCAGPVAKGKTTRAALPPALRIIHIRPLPVSLVRHCQRRRAHRRPVPSPAGQSKSSLLLT